VTSRFQTEDSAQTELHPEKSNFLKLVTPIRFELMASRLSVVCSPAELRGIGEPDGIRTRNASWHQVEGLAA
jgi:hypothetical protein